MRILIIVPTFHYKYEYPAFTSYNDLPAGLAYLASALKQAGHEVFGVNPNNDAGYTSACGMLYDKMQRAVKEFQPGLIAVGGLCTDYTFLKDAVRMARELAPHTPVVCGGGIINQDPEFVFGLFRPDFCIVGDGEEHIVQLVGLLEKGTGNYEDIPNLGYWQHAVALQASLVGAQGEHLFWHEEHEHCSDLGLLYQNP